MIRSLSLLMGERGRAIVCELAPAAEASLAYLFAEFGGPPPGLARVLQHGIRPAALGLGDLVAAGETHEYTDMYPGMARTAREDVTPPSRFPGR